MKVDNFNIQDIEEGLKLLAIKRKEEEATPEESNGEKIKSVWVSVMKSKHFDIVKTLFISLFLALLAYNLPNFYFNLIGKENINADFAGMIQRHSFAAFGFFTARLVVDTTLYFNENKFYVFLKRNGNYAFDYQENLTELTKWQQTIITSLKYSCYLFLYILLYQA